MKNYKVDLCNLDDTEAIFLENTDIVGVIHFAAYKSVPESVNEPLLYFKNNFNSLINILQCAEDFDVNNFVFSSSCSVYGNTTELPVVEETFPSGAGITLCAYQASRRSNVQGFLYH